MIAESQCVKKTRRLNIANRSSSEREKEKNREKGEHIEGDFRRINRLIKAIFFSLH